MRTALKAVFPGKAISDHIIAPAPDSRQLAMAEGGHDSYRELGDDDADSVSAVNDNEVAPDADVEEVARTFVEEGTAQDERGCALEHMVADLEMRLQDIANLVQGNVSDYYLGLDDDSSADGCGTTVVDPVIAGPTGGAACRELFNARLLLRHACLSNRLLDIADLVGGDIQDYFLGLDAECRR